MILISVLLFIGLSIFLVWYLLSKDRGEREPASGLWAALGFGLLAAVIASFAEAGFVKDDTLKGGLSGAMVLAALGIGIVEEAAKFVPLALFIYKKRYFNENTDGILYFALAGIGLGLPENILYTLGFGPKAGILRLIMTPFFHAATVAIPGYYLARNKVNRRPFKYVIFALLGVMLLHAVYDFGLASGISLLVLMSFVVTIGLSVALFVLATVAKREDQEVGLSVVGTNTYCRSCAYPNPKHKLYCEKCGKRA